MRQLIDFSEYRPETIKYGAVRKELPTDKSTEEFEDNYRLTLNILVHNNPHKLLFTLKEAALLLGVSEEFVRRRVKNCTIKACYMGDKPSIQITELARIITIGTQ